MDDLEDAQSVTSFVHSDDSPDYMVSEGASYSISVEDAPISNNFPHHYPNCELLNQFKSDRPNGSRLEDWDGSLRAVFVLTLDWLSSAFFLSSRENVSGIGIWTRRYMPKIGVVDHNGCISPDLGRTASTQLRACGLVGSLYTPDTESLVGVHKQRERACWLRALPCP